MRPRNCPGGVEADELEPASVWERGQPELVSADPVEKELGIQEGVEVPLLDAYLVTLVPDVLVEQYADPTDE